MTVLYLYFIAINWGKKNFNLCKGFRYATICHICATLCHVAFFGFFQKCHKKKSFLKNRFIQLIAESNTRLMNYISLFYRLRCGHKLAKTENCIRGTRGTRGTNVAHVAYKARCANV